MSFWELFVLIVSSSFIIFCGLMILIKAFVNEWYEARREHIQLLANAAGEALNKAAEDIRNDIKNGSLQSAFLSGMEDGIKSAQQMENALKFNTKQEE